MWNLTADMITPTNLKDAGFTVELLAHYRGMNETVWIIRGTGMRVTDDYGHGVVTLHRGMTNLGTFTPETIVAGVVAND